MVQRLTMSKIKNYFELAEGFSLIEVQAPPLVVGKTLRELDLRQKSRVNLVAIKRTEKNADGEEVVKEFKAVPLPDERITENDILALAGSVLDLAAFMGDNS
jgi:trk system potassium uptake protein TrkA